MTIKIVNDMEWRDYKLKNPPSFYLNATTKRDLRDVRARIKRWQRGTDVE